jgi:hypothetical protein
MNRSTDPETLEPLANQTQFVVEEAACEEPSLPKLQASPLGVPSSSPNKKLFLLGAVAGVLMLLTLVLLVMKPRRSTQQLSLPTPTPTVNLSANPELKARIDELQADLQNADPAKNDFTFPLVDLRLQLEKTQ